MWFRDDLSPSDSLNKFYKTGQEVQIRTKDTDDWEHAVVCHFLGMDAGAVIVEKTDKSRLAVTRNQIRPKQE